MTVAAPSMGWQAKLGMSPSGVAAEAYEFVSENVQMKKQHLTFDGIRGIRDEQAETICDGTTPVDGPCSLLPTPQNLVNLLPRILGAARQAGTPAVYGLANTIPSFNYVADRVAEVFTYTGMKVAKAVFKSSKDKPLSLDLTLAGLNASIGAAGTFPVLTLGLVQPYMHHQATIVINGVTYFVEDLMVTVDNGLVLDETRNSQTRLSLPEGPRLITVEVNTMWTADELALLTLGLGTSNAGVAGTATYVSGSNTLIMSWPGLQVPQEDPGVQNRARPLGLKTTFVARRSATIDAMSVTQTI